MKIMAWMGILGETNGYTLLAEFYFRGVVESEAVRRRELAMEASPAAESCYGNVVVALEDLNRGKLSVVRPKEEG